MECLNKWVKDNFWQMDQYSNNEHFEKGMSEIERKQLDISR